MFYVLLSMNWDAAPYQASYVKDVTVTLQIPVMGSCSGS
jgi:hypothetical protein